MHVFESKIRFDTPGESPADAGDCYAGELSIMVLTLR